MQIYEKVSIFQTFIQSNNQILSIIENDDKRWLFFQDKQM